MLLYYNYQGNIVIPIRLSKTSIMITAIKPGPNCHAHHFHPSNPNAHSRKGDFIDHIYNPDFIPIFSAHQFGSTTFFNPFRSLITLYPLN